MLKKGTLLETAFEDYQILNQIGQGGNGTVFLAQASSDSNKVAVKIIDKNISTKDKIKRFKNEINFCQKNSSENIISVLDYGVYKDGGKNCLFYVMPYYVSTLKHEIQKGIEPLKIIEIFIQILNGIEFAHTKNVWHRDLKPENILYNPKENKAVIADFGIAHFCEEEIITAVETKAGERLANYLYSAPEQKIKGSIINGRADIFALGLILNEMFTKNIISGTKYKLIKESCEEYAYLDEVVSELIAQNQNERLYPAKKILIELTTRSKIEVNKKEIEKLASKKLEVDDNYDLILSAPNVSNLEYKNNVLFIHLDRVTDETWNKILKQGGFSHSSLMSYNTNSFSSSISSDKMHTIFNVSVRNENESTIKDIVKYFKEWLPTVNSIYIHQQKQSKDELRRQEIARREFEIKEAEKNIRINNQLKSLF